MSASEAIHIETIVVGPLAVNAYLVGDPESRKAFLLDPGDEAGLLKARIEAGGWELTEVVLTHAHFDHVLAASEIVDEYGVPFTVPTGEVALLEQAPATVEMWMGFTVDPPPAPDRLLQEGDRVQAGDHPFEVVASPGHSPGGICLLGEGVAFVGDTLFAGSVGRTDLPGGDPRVLMESIQRHLMPLPDETRILPGHGPETTMGRERRSNPFLAGLRAMDA